MRKKSKQCISNKPKDANGLLEMLRDQIAEREKADTALAKQVKFLQTLIDAIPTPIFYKDINGIYQGCNREFLSYLGISQEQVVGKSVYDLAPREMADKYHQADLDLLHKSGVQIYESKVQFADGQWRDVLFHKATYKDGNDNVIGLVGIMLDITERKDAEKKLTDSEKRLRVINDEIVHAMSTVTETRDVYTAGHQKRVAELAVAIGKEMALSPERLEGLRVAGLLHDIGKIAVPAEILSKPSKLTKPEFEIVKCHSQAGFDILKAIEFPWPIAKIVLQHHERIDGSGYPEGLRGQDILLEAKVLAVADVVEAMAAHRPYRPSLGTKKALEEIQGNRGRIYDSAVVDACIRAIEKADKTGDLDGAIQMQAANAMQGAWRDY